MRIKTGRCDLPVPPPPSAPPPPPRSGEDFKVKLWRLIRAPYVALDGSGPALHGARWTSPGLPVVNFASEPGLAVLVVLRYLPRDLRDIDDDYLLGWTETSQTPERLERSQSSPRWRLICGSGS